MESSRMFRFGVGALLLVGYRASAFSVSSQRSTMTMTTSLLDKFPNPFSKDDSSGASRPPSLFPSASAESSQTAPEALVAKAKNILSFDFGVLDETLLDDNFIWIGPTLGSKVLGKADFLAAGKYFDLRTAFPDLDYRSHDFRIDDKDPLTIRLTARTVGSMRGELRLRNEIVEPNGVQMRCPPEAISMTFDENTGKLVKLCLGFAMDRLVGNTGGLCGVMGAATVAGVPPSEWEVYPATTVVQRFIGRPVQQLEEPTSFLAPFPETVMIQLAKGILAADMAAEDPDLLGASFTFCTPYEGPVDKKKYIDSYATEVFGGTDPELTHFRVDPYDPYRVWVDVRQPEGAPEAMSFTFDDDGFCTRITAWAVMDPSIGNSGGLGGKPGVLYAEGKALPGIVSRPLPQVLGRVQKRIFEPITKVGVDDYRLPGSGPAPVGKSVEVEAAPKSPLSRISLNVDTETKPKAPGAKPPAPKKEPTISATPFFSSPTLQLPVTPKKAPAAPQIKKATVDKKAGAQAAAAERKAKAEQAAAEKKAKAEQAAAERKAKAERAASERKAKAKQAAAERKAKAEQAAAARAAKAREAAEAKKAKLEAAVATRQAKAEEAAAEKKARAEAAAAAQKAKLEAAKKAKPARTATRAVAPRAVTRAVTPKPKPTKTEQIGAFEKAKAAAAAALQKAKAEEATAPSKAKADALAAAKKSKAAEAAAAKRAKADAAAAARQAKAEAAAAARQAKAEAAAAAKRQREEAAAAAKRAREDAAGRKAATVAKKTKAAPAPQLKVAPRGVPTLARWRKNRDGSVTGFITGSDAFDDGEQITTSEIEVGEYKKGNVVQTSSGSKYFLS